MLNKTKDSKSVQKGHAVQWKGSCKNIVTQ